MRKFILGALVVFMSAKMVSAEVYRMRCGEDTYQLEKSLLKKATVTFRAAAKWENWCTGHADTLSIYDDGAKCQTKGGLKDPTGKLFGLSVANNTVLDFVLFEKILRDNNDEIITRAQCSKLK